MFSILGGSIGANINWPFSAPVRGGTDIHSAGRIMQTLFATGNTFATNPYYENVPFDGSTGGGVLDRLQYIQDEIINAIVPVGSIIAFDGVTPPNNWLIADGSCVSQATYPRLYNVLNNRHGVCPAGDFKLPDLRGRMIAGVDDIVNNRIDDTLFPDNYTLGKTGGNDTTTLAVGDMPAHNHGDTLTSTSSLGDHNHVITDHGHAHEIVMNRINSTTISYNSIIAGVVGKGVTFFNSPGFGHSYDEITFSIKGNPTNISLGDSNQNHNHNITIQSQGSNNTISNMPNFMTLNYIIKY